MSKLIPDYVFDSIYDITPEVLTAHGVRGVLVDLDGTMASHKAALPPARADPARPDIPARNVCGTSESRSA